MTADNHFNKPDPVFSAEAAPKKPTPESAPAESTPPEGSGSEFEKEIAELKDRLLRALAETENVRRRAEREREDTAKYAVTAFARDMLSVADNLSRALAAVGPDARGKDASVDALIAGIELTDRELTSIFERHGIRRIDPMGERFDHNFHQAMMEVEDPSKPSGTVVQVLQTGYVLRERLLRPAMVAVSRGGKTNAPPPANDPDRDDAGHTVDTQA
jgi:molecular chaperone GrpE